VKRVVQLPALAMLAASLYVAPFAVTTAFAEVYKYKNAEGVWVFTDEKPEGAELSNAKPIITKQQNKVAVVNKGTEDKPVLYATSSVHGPVEVWLDFGGSQNVKFSQKEPFYWVITGPGEEQLLELEAEDTEQEWSYGWRASYVPGAPVTQSSLNKSPLGLPSKGGPFVVSTATDNDVRSKFGVDIAAPESTPVIAVKSGVVMDTEKDFSAAGAGLSQSSGGDVVRVLHRDGSMGLYSNFRVEGIEVVPGQKVRKGQLIGYSGPEKLSFALQINDGKKLISVPFRFEGYDRIPQNGDVVGPN
jgi:murein DD-endopeptidase MepM/ murein hydrolase activator NlpD